MPKGESLIPKAGARNDAQEVEMDEENIVKDMEEVTPMDDGKLVNEGLVDGPDIPDVTRATQQTYKYSPIGQESRPPKRYEEEFGEVALTEAERDYYNSLLELSCAMYLMENSELVVEVGVVKVKTKTSNKLKDKGVPCMFIGYTRNHLGDCYRMYNPRMYNLDTRGAHESQDMVWLRRMYYSIPARAGEISNY